MKLRLVVGGLAFTAAVAATALAHAPGGPPAGGPPPGLPPGPPQGGPAMGGPGGGGMHMGGPGGGGPVGAPGSGHGGGPGAAQPGHPGGPPPGAMLARAADADRSGDVSSDEWSAFLASLDEDGDGVADLAALGAALGVPSDAPADAVAAQLKRVFDRDRDGDVEISELQAFFDAMDTNGDGALDADDRPGHHAPPPPPPSGPERAALGLARAADADMSGDVSGDEWAAYLASLDEDGDGIVDGDDVEDSVPPCAGRRAPRHVGRELDHDGDGLLEIEDLQALFDLLDADGDGALSRDELGALPPPPPRHRGPAMALARAADADEDGTVTEDERDAFLDALGTDDAGAISLDDLAAALGLPEPPDGDTTRRDARLLHDFDTDRDGAVTRDELAALLLSLDRDADGSIERAELKKKKRHRRR